MGTTGLIILLAFLVIAQMGLIAGIIGWLSKRIKIDDIGNVYLKGDIYVFSKEHFKD